MTRDDDRRAMTAFNRTHIAIAVIAALPPTITSIASVIVASRAVAKVEVVTGKVEEIHKATNSMKDALVAATRKEALIEGHVEGQKKGVELGVASEKSRAVRAKENQAKGAAEEKAKPWFKR